jgi:cytochrome bd-type quinol oxidase subunit 2
MSNETLVKSYMAAVGSALAVAFGLATVIQKKYPGHQAKAMMKWVAFPSAVVASSLNCFIVRSPEIETGISLLDDQLQPVSDDTSQEAARRGVYSTTLSRAMLQAPVYFLAPLLVGIGPIRTFLQAHPRQTVPVTTFLLLVSFGVGLPASVACFPQMAEIPVQEVEPQFQHLVDARTNQPYKVYYYNKGL